MSSFTYLRLGHPHAMYDFTTLGILIEALLGLTKLPLKIWHRRNSCNTWQTFGTTPSMSRILRTNAISILQGPRSCSFSYHPTHSNLSHIFLINSALFCFIDKFFPCFSKQFWGQIIPSRSFTFNSANFLRFFLRVFVAVRTFFYFSGTASMFPARIKEQSS